MTMVETTLGRCDTCKGRNNVVYVRQLNSYFCMRINRYFTDYQLIEKCDDKLPLKTCSCLKDD